MHAPVPIKTCPGTRRRQSLCPLGPLHMASCLRRARPGAGYSSRLRARRTRKRSSCFLLLPTRGRHDCKPSRYTMVPMRPKGGLWQLWTSRSELDGLAVHCESVELIKLLFNCASGALLGITMGNLKKLADNVLSSEQVYYGEVHLFLCLPALTLRCSRSNSINGTARTSSLTGCFGASKITVSRLDRRLSRFSPYADSRSRAYTGALTSSRASSRRLRLRKWRAA
jgi:hypothetical protein